MYLSLFGNNVNSISIGLTLYKLILNKFYLRKVNELGRKLTLAHLLNSLPSWGTEPGMVQNTLADVACALETQGSICKRILV